MICFLKDDIAQVNDIITIIPSQFVEYCFVTEENTFRKYPKAGCVVITVCGFVQKDKSLLLKDMELRCNIFCDPVSFE